MRVIRGRRALVTGAASGIGKAIARSLAAEGAHLFLIDRDAERMAAAVQEIGQPGVEIHVAVCDLAVAAEVTKAIGQMRAVWSEVHIVVNSAGLVSFGAFHLAAEDDWRRIVAVNLFAPMQIVHELLATLLCADEAHVLNVCSLFGLVPARKVPVYQTSKYGLVGFTLGLRYEYFSEKFGVTALCPGFVRTPFLENVPGPEADKVPAGVPVWLSTSAEKVAAKAIVAIRRNKGVVVVTPFARLAWWLWRFSPRFFDWLLREGYHWIENIKLLAPADRDA